MGKLCRHGHDHGGGSYRGKNGDCFQCADIRIARWTASQDGVRSRALTKARRKTKATAENKQYRQRERERILEYNRRYRAENPEWFRAYYREYNARRKAIKRQAIPSWASLEAIEAIYRQAQQLSTSECRLDVDHIVPLISDKVCGLHCEANLQILPARVNQSKGNRWWPDMAT